MNEEQLAAVREVVDAANEKVKWDALAPSVDDLEDRAGALFRSQSRDVKAALASWRKRWPVQEAELPERITRYLERVLSKRRGRDASRLVPPMLSAIGAALKTIGKARWGISFTLEDVRATAYMKARGAELVRELNTTTIADIRRILSEGISEGWSYDRVGKEIVAKYASYAAPRGQRGIPTRAHLIAVTENAFAYEHSHLEQARMLAAAGLPMLKEWGVSGDERTCETCEGNGGEGAIALEQSFASGDAMPPAHPACRCWSETYIDPAAPTPDNVTVNGQTVTVAV